MPSDQLPRSLSLTLRALRCRFQLTVEQLCQELDQTPNKIEDREHKPTSPSVIKNAESRKRWLYWVAHKYAGRFGYPVGFIYLLSRFSCDLRDKKFDDVEALADGLIALANYIKDNKGKIAQIAPTGSLPEMLNDYQRFDGTSPYEGSVLQYRDARQVLILLNLLDNVPPPFPPAPP